MQYPSPGPPLSLGCSGGVAGSPGRAARAPGAAAAAGSAAGVRVRSPAGRLPACHQHPLPGAGCNFYSGTAGCGGAGRARAGGGRGCPLARRQRQLCSQRWAPERLPHRRSKSCHARPCQCVATARVCSSPATSHAQRAAHCAHESQPAVWNAPTGSSGLAARTPGRPQAAQWSEGPCAGRWRRQRLGRPAGAGGRQRWQAAPRRDPGAGGAVCGGPGGAADGQPGLWARVMQDWERN